MTDPLADQLAALAPTVDTRTAYDAFVALRSRRRRRRRWITGAVTTSMVIAGGAAVVVLAPWNGPDTVATTAQSSPTASAASTSTTTGAGVAPSSTLSATPTASPTVLLTADGCPPISSEDLRTSDAVSLFGRVTPAGTSIQAVATPAGIEGPYVAVMRYRTATRNPTIGDPVDINGHRGRLFVGDEGQGELSWLLPDNSEAYLRSRGLDADQLGLIARALVPRPADAAVAGFEVNSGVPGGFALVAETVAPVTVSTAMTSCAPVNGADLRVGVVNAPLAVQYAIGVDQLPLPALEQRDDHLVWAVSHDPATAAAALGTQPSTPRGDVGPETTVAPLPTVSFTIERSAVGQAGCTVPACRFVDVTLAGFAPGSTVTIECHSDITGPFGATDITIAGDGTAIQEACHFGWPNERFWVTANGFTSPTITWPTG